MPCYGPLQGYWSKTLTPLGNRRVVFNADDGYIDRPIEVPCGQCIGCRIHKMQEWGVRCVHEALMHEHSWFVTLTYDPEHLPKDLSVNKDEHQRFMKRLRYYTGQKIRFFMCGEYGDDKGRPHYHYLLFGLELADLEYWRKGSSKHNRQITYPIYRSLTLERAWQKGFVELGEVNIQSAQYVAGYVRKKITGKKLDETNSDGLKPYELYNDITGELIKREPEFSLMSRNPGIGSAFYEKYGDQIRRLDHVVVNSKRMRVPKYYDRITKKLHPSVMESIVRSRRFTAQKRIKDQTPERLRQREAYMHAVTKNSMKGEL